jgi:hypothetical protein
VLWPVATQKGDAAPGPLTVELIGESGTSRALDRRLAHGVGIWLRSSEG